MASEKQIEANRLNAMKSSGPKTEQGKAVSRRNSLEHGLSAKTLLPQDFEAKKDQRLTEWRACLTPDGAVLEFELELAVAASLRIEQSQSCETKRRVVLAEIAADPSDKWDQARKADAARLGLSLKRDPVGVSLQLRMTPAGREWLLTEWRQLLKGVRENDRCHWVLAESNHALDLLGTPSTIRPPVVPFHNQFDPIEMARTIVLREIASLEALQVNAAAENAQLRQEHIEGQINDTDTKLKMFRRYEAAALRQFRQSLKVIRQAQAANSKPAQAKAIPQVAPVPECGTNPIQTSVAPQVAAAPVVEMTSKASTSPSGNRLYRRKQQKAERHDAYLARNSA